MRFPNSRCFQACHRSFVFLVSSPGFAVLDSGCGKTIIGDRTLKQFQKLWQDDGRYSPKFKSETKVFKFGKGERETSTSTVIMPVGLAGRFGTVQAAVVQGDAPLLLSRPALKRLGATIDFHADRLQLFSHGAIDLNLKSNAAGRTEGAPDMETLSLVLCTLSWGLC